MTAIEALANNSIVSRNYFFLVTEIIKIWSFSTFDVYNTESLSITTILWIRSPGLIYLPLASLYTYTISLLYSHPLVPANHHLLSAFMSSVLDSTYKWHHTVYVFV